MCACERENRQRVADFSSIPQNVASYLPSPSPPTYCRCIPFWNNIGMIPGCFHNSLLASRFLHCSSAVLLRDLQRYESMKLSKQAIKLPQAARGMRGTFSLGLRALWKCGDCKLPCHMEMLTCLTQLMLHDSFHTRPQHSALASNLRL